MKVFIDSYNDWVLLATSYVGDYYAKDIVQEAFIKIHDKEKLNRSYIFFTIRSLCIDFIRQRNKIKKESINDYNFLNENNDDESIYFKKLIEKIDHSIKDWHWYDEMLFKIYKDDGVSMRHISKETTISLSSIFTSISKYKEDIRKNFKEDYQDLKNKDYERI